MGKEGPTEVANTKHASQTVPGNQASGACERLSVPLCLGRVGMSPRSRQSTQGMRRDRAGEASSLSPCRAFASLPSPSTYTNLPAPPSLRHCLVRPPSLPLSHLSSQKRTCVAHIGGPSLVASSCCCRCLGLPCCECTSSRLVCPETGPAFSVMVMVVWVGAVWGERVVALLVDLLGGGRGGGREGGREEGLQLGTRALQRQKQGSAVSEVVMGWCEAKGCLRCGRVGRIVRWVKHTRML